MQCLGLSFLRASECHSSENFISWKASPLAAVTTYHFTLSICCNCPINSSLNRHERWQGLLWSFFARKKRLDRHAMSNRCACVLQINPEYSMHILYQAFVNRALNTVLPQSLAILLQKRSNN